MWHALSLVVQDGVRFASDGKVGGGVGWSEWVESDGEAMGNPSKKKKGARPKAKGKSKARASRPTADCR